MYIGICSKKYKNGVEFPCHDNISLIIGLSHTGNVLTQPFNYILKTIKAQFQTMEKRINNSTLREKLLSRNYSLHIESASLCPLSLNTLFSPQALPLFIENFIISLI